MVMKSSILLIITLLAAGSGFSQNKTVFFATFKSQMDIKGTKLLYNGASLREKHTIDIYVAALYLPNQTMNGTTVINVNEVQVIELKILSNKVTREKFINAVNDGVAKVSDGKANTEEIIKFIGFFLRN